MGVQTQEEVDWGRKSYVTNKPWARGWRKTENVPKNKKKPNKSRKKKSRNN